MSQVDLADKLKWDKTKLCRVELGRQEPDAAEVELIAAALGLSMPEFYGAIDEKPRKARAS